MKKDSKKNDVGGLPVYEVVFVEDSSTGIETINLTAEPNNGFHFIAFSINENDENTNDKTN